MALPLIRLPIGSASAKTPKKQNTRRYAKRQLTWFNHQGEFESFEPTDVEKLKAYLDIVLQYS